MYLYVFYPYGAQISVDQVFQRNNSFQYTTVSRSQLGNFSYKICILTTPNGLCYLNEYIRHTTIRPSSGECATTILTWFFGV